MANSAPFTMFEACAGSGMFGAGIRIALESIGLRTDVVGACELEVGAAATFLAGLEAETGRRCPFWDDAKTFASCLDLAGIAGTIEIDVKIEGDAACRYSFQLETVIKVGEMLDSRTVFIKQ